ncbi:glutathione S-transferase [Tabrizicola sp. BL-A-41-H6]|uniref:glutathione S-transferase n=1 Tax=Tabrizicola sp. BL-A-41-H6 TaxID=3421107 RepID=UPI003D669414
MHLYYAPASPFVRKVMILLHEAQATDHVTLVPAAGNPLDPGSMPVAQNPLGKIPALARDDGPALYDSRVICRYLDDRFGTGLYPAAPRLWDVLTLEATADGIADAAVLMRYEQVVRPESTRSPEWIDAQWAKVDRALTAVETQSMPLLLGPLTIAQVAMGAALGYLDFRQADRNWRAGRPALAAWWATFAKRPSVVATGPES